MHWKFRDNHLLEAKRLYKEASRWNIYWEHGPLRIIENLLPWMGEIIETASSLYDKFERLQARIDLLEEHLEKLHAKNDS